MFSTLSQRIGILVQSESAGWVLASAAVAGSRWRRLVGARLWTSGGAEWLRKPLPGPGPPQLLPDQRSKDPRACSLLGSSEIKLIKTTDNAALETTSCFLLFWLALFRFCKINDQQRRSRRHLNPETENRSISLAPLFLSSILPSPKLRLQQQEGTKKQCLWRMSHVRLLLSS